VTRFASQLGISRRKKESRRQKTDSNYRRGRFRSDSFRERPFARESCEFRHPLRRSAPPPSIPVCTKLPLRHRLPQGRVGIGAATDIRLVRLATATVLSSSHVPGRPQDSLKRGPTINGRAV